MKKKRSVKVGDIYIYNNQTSQKNKNEKTLLNFNDDTIIFA